jgi:hypothetical protein
VMATSSSGPPRPQPQGCSGCPKATPTAPGRTSTSPSISTSTSSKSTKAAATRAASEPTSPATLCASRWSAVWCGTRGTARSSTPPRWPLRIRCWSTPRSTPRTPRSTASS